MSKRVSPHLKMAIRSQKSVKNIKKQAKISQNLTIAEVDDSCDIFKKKAEEVRTLLGIGKREIAISQGLELADSVDENPSSQQVVGLLLLDLGLLKEAEPFLQKAVKLSPENDYLRYKASLLYKDSPNKRIDFLKRSLIHCPASFFLWVAIGNEYKRVGKLERALAAYQKAEQLRPDDIDLIFNMSGLVSYKDQGDQKIKFLVEQLDRDIAKEKKALAAFTLGKAHMDRGLFDRAFQYYSLGNQLQKDRMELRFQLTRNQLESLCKNFTVSLFSIWKEVETFTPQDVFIVGMSRSGKTLIENILADSSKLLPARESLIFSNFARHKLNKNLVRNSRSYLDSLTSKKLLEERREYFNLSQEKKKIFTQTMPWNINFLGFLGLWSPHTPIIFVARDPLDLGISCYFKIYGVGNSYSYDLYTLGKQIGFYERLQQHWIEILPNPVLVVNYESLVSSPELIIPDIFYFLGLEFDQEFMNSIMTKSSGSHVGFGQSFDVVTAIKKDFIGCSRPFESYLSELHKGYLDSKK